MGNMLKPDVPGPTAEEIRLQQQQAEALREEERQKSIKLRKTSKTAADIGAGRIGLRSLLTGGFSGFKLGG